MELIIGFLFFLIPLTLGLIVGGLRERSHLSQLAEREQATGDILVTQLKSFPSASRDPVHHNDAPPKLLIGEAVIATDYLKSFLARLRNIFGGEVRSFQTLLTRARREALLRIVEQAQREGYNAVCNVRYENADVGGNTGAQSKIPMAAILASGTAYQADTSGPWIT